MMPGRHARYPLRALCVTGLAAEAEIARRAGFRAVTGGGDRRRTAALVTAAIGEADCLVSFGIAGALSPQLRPGDVVLSAEIMSLDGCWRAAEAWQQRLVALAHAIGAVAAPMLGAREILATRADKAHARATFGALAVDLESDIAACAAETAGIPFAALRAIADPAERDIPPAALLPLAANGTPDLAGVIGSLFYRPRQIGALLGLAHDTRLAFRALRRTAPALHCLLAGG